MAFLEKVHFMMLLLAMVLVSMGFAQNVDAFGEVYDVVGRNAHGLDDFSGLVPNAFIHAARAVSATATDVTRVTISLGPTSTSEISSTQPEVTRVTFSIEPSSTSEVSSTPIEVTRVTISLEPTETLEVSTTDTETEPCGGEETTLTFSISPTSTGPASTPATGTSTKVTLTIIPTSTATETETETVTCSHSSACHTKGTTSTGFGFTISLTSTIINKSTSSSAPATSASTLITKPSTPGVQVTSTKNTVETTPLKTGTTAAGTATSTAVFNGAQKMEGLNKLTVTGILLLVCKLVL